MSIFDMQIRMQHCKKCAQSFLRHGSNLQKTIFNVGWMYFTLNDLFCGMGVLYRTQSFMWDESTLQFTVHNLFAGWEYFAVHNL